MKMNANYIMLNALTDKNERSNFVFYFNFIMLRKLQKITQVITGNYLNTDDFFVSSLEVAQKHFSFNKDDKQKQGINEDEIDQDGISYASEEIKDASCIIHEGKTCIKLITKNNETLLIPLLLKY